MVIELSAIYQFPIKSLSGLPYSEAMVKPYGLESDRCMMLVDENGMFISQRKHPQLALINVHYVGNKLEISIENKEKISIDNQSFGNQKFSVKVWEDLCDAYVANSQINAWFSDFLQQRVLLVKYDFENPRPTNPNYSLNSDIVNFADGFPILMISENSLLDLNQRLDKPVSMLNFRPNFVIKGCSAFAEDEWKKIRIGQLKFELVKQCSRCVLTTVDPRTGVKHEKGQPLKMLSTYRRKEMGVMFGINLIPRSDGFIFVGDKVEILQ